MYYTVGMKTNLTPANVTEIEFADEGAELAYQRMLTAPRGSAEEHAQAHAFVDWLAVKHLGHHVPDCSGSCPFAPSAI